MRYGLAQRVIACVVLALVCIAWGFIGPIVKVCIKYTRPEVVVATRYLLSTITCIMLLFSCRHAVTTLREYLMAMSYLRVGQYLLPNVVVILLCALSGFTISIPAFFISISLCGVYFTYAVGITLTILLTTLLRVVTKEEVLTKYKVAYSVLLLVVLGLTLTLYHVKPLGLLMVFMFALSWSVYLWLAGHICRQLSAKIRQALTALTDILIASTFGFLTVYYMFNIRPGELLHFIKLTFTNIELLLLNFLALVLVCTVLAYLATYIVVSMFPDLIVLFSMFQYVEIIQGVLIGAFIFNEMTLNLNDIIYIIVICISLAMCIYLRMRDVR